MNMVPSNSSGPSPVIPPSMPRPPGSGPPPMSSHAHSHGMPMSGPGTNSMNSMVNLNGVNNSHSMVNVNHGMSSHSMGAVNSHSHQMNSGHSHYSHHMHQHQPQSNYPPMTNASPSPRSTSLTNSNVNVGVGTAMPAMPPNASAHPAASPSPYHGHMPPMHSHSQHHSHASPINSVRPPSSSQHSHHHTMHNQHHPHQHHPQHVNHTPHHPHSMMPPQHQHHHHSQSINHPPQHPNALPSHVPNHHSQHSHSHSHSQGPHPPPQPFSQSYQQHPHPPQAGPPPLSHTNTNRSPPSSMSKSSTQVNYLPTSNNGNWQSSNDDKHRKEIIGEIFTLLRKTRRSPEWLDKLPNMVKQLEVSLYKSAPTFEAYVDKNTLQHRLQLLATQIHIKTKEKHTPDTSPDDINRDRSSTRSPFHNIMMPFENDANAMGPSSNSSRDRDRDRDRDQYINHSSSNSNNNSMNIHPRSSQSSIGGASNRTSSMEKSQVVHMDQINPMAMSSNNSIGPSGNNNSSPPFGGSTTGSVYSSSRKSHIPGSNSSAASQTRTNAEYQQRINMKQQRLMLLYHASKCKSEGDCPKWKYCGEMKKLWRHMQDCADANCRVDHCISSRTILSHYTNCKDEKCPTCRPVREMVQENKRKNREASSANHKDVPSSSSSNSSRHLLQPPQQQNHHNYHHPQQSMSNPNHMYPSRMSNSLNDQFHGKMSLPPPPHQSNNPHYRPNPPTPNNYSSSYGPPPSSSSYTSRNGDGKSMMYPSSESPRYPRSSESVRSARSEQHEQGSSELQLRIKARTDRLLLLRHASKCTLDSGKCPEPLCDNMKKLWSHINKCREKECTEPHCMSSRYVLSHYKTCKDPECQACKPVKEAVAKEQLKKTEIMSSSNNGLVPSSLSPAEQPDTKRIRMNDNIQPPTITSDSSSLSKSKPASSVSQQEPSSESASGSSSATTKRSEDPSCSLINSFSITEIELHIRSLNRTMQLSQKDLKDKCMPVLKTLQNHEFGWVFNAPVDPVSLNLPDYYDIITKPMDLGTINKKLDTGLYHSIHSFQADVKLTFDNAMTYNEQGSVVHGWAKAMMDLFLEEYKKLCEQLIKEEEERRRDENACRLCGCVKLYFEPPTFFCYSINCPSKRINRNRFFYSAGNNQYVWCSQCYGELDGDTAIELPDLSVKKIELKKKKNDEMHEENWVQCDVCNRWIHQICGLFNSRQNKDNASKYTCPQCLLDSMKEGKTFPKPRSPTAEDLPRTILSEWLEYNVRVRLVDQYKALAQEKVEIEKIPYDEAHNLVSGGGAITIRQVTSTDQKVEVRERMKNRYASLNYPTEFPYRCKCILVFQNQDGVDIVLFALYIFEHGKDNPPPNHRTVYISYLDSVHFMRPRKLRTFVYHEILSAYLDYARQKGFISAHIWACPPLKGDDYIFYAKPDDQKTPKDGRLRQWYIDMLTECQKRNIVGKVTNMYDLYFKNDALDATVVPYLEGDYFSGEVENIIKDIEEGKSGKSGASGKKNKKKTNDGDSANKSKSKNGRKGTRSTPIDDELVSSNTYIQGTKDPVMSKLAEIIHSMRDSFIVAFLCSEGAKPENMEVPKDIMAYREKAATEKAEQGGSESVRKRDLDGNMRTLTLKSIGSGNIRDKNGNHTKIIDDDSEELDCEILNNRQAFLNLCRGNHYQFDELRRAKHTSMMVLWHLHNRDAAKFVQICASCSKEILSGTRYTCSTCTDYDLCEECYKNPETNRGSCTHELVAKSIVGNQSESDSSSQLTEAQREERQRHLQLHIKLLEHSSLCKIEKCTPNCVKMKTYLKHSQECKIKVAGGCKFCKRVLSLFRHHAQSCKNKSCPIPHCESIKERMRQLAKQQQAMDDRRRQVMNRQYRMGGSTT